MSKADEMFEELGYEKIQDDKYWVDYKKRNHNISFNLTNKFIEATRLYGEEYIDKRLNIKELQAINEKVKELRLEQLDRREER